MSLEGGEGAGKSTQAVRLGALLRARGFETLLTREPGGSPRAEAIRAVLLEGRVKPLGAFAEAALFAAARLDHVRTTIAPALTRGVAVVSDRYVDSTRVYQGAVAGVDASLLAGLEGAATGAVLPDLTLVLDLPAETGLARAAARRSQTAQGPDRFEGEGLAYHARVREAFLAIAAAEPERCAVIDAARPPDEVAAAIETAILSRLAIPEPPR